eukprot:1157363-Pelagomonas_calceolata.AAC.12
MPGGEVSGCGPVSWWPQGDASCSMRLSLGGGGLRLPQAPFGQLHLFDAAEGGRLCGHCMVARHGHKGAHPQPHQTGAAAQMELAATLAPPPSSAALNSFNGITGAPAKGAAAAVLPRESKQVSLHAEQQPACIEEGTNRQSSEGIHNERPPSARTGLQMP